MAIALVATTFLLPSTPPVGRRTSLIDPFRALRYPGLLTIALTALFYNMGFFTLLAFTPFPLDMTAHQVGLIFFGWGLLLAITSVWVAPMLQRRIGSIPTVLASLSLFGLDLAAMAIWTDDKTVLVVGVIVAGAFLGVNNTVITEAVMGAAPVERAVASAAYSFVRFSGGAVAPYAAGKLGENVSVHAPFWMGAGAVGVAILVLSFGARYLRGEELPARHGEAEAEMVAAGDAS
jgi:ACDE family multidrug resistance protein